MYRILHLILFVMIILVPATSSAIEQVGVPVAWTTESYRAYAYTDYIFNYDPESNEAFGPPFPVSAGKLLNTTQASSYIEDDYMLVSAYSGSSNELSGGIAEFTGNYTASNPYFIFSYNFGAYGGEGWLTITDTDSSTVLIDTNTSWSSNTISVNTPVGQNIEVNFGIRADAYPGNGEEDASIDYTMGVAPEPMSMILFGTGGVLLAGHRLMTKKQRSS